MKTSESYLNKYINYMLNVPEFQKKENSYRIGFMDAMERIKEIVDMEIEIEEHYENTGT